MKQSYLALKQHLVSPDARTAIGTEASAQAMDLLHVIAVASSDEEWLQFATEEFSLDAMPPILLNSNQMRMLRGGGLPSVATLLRLLPHK